MVHGDEGEAAASFSFEEIQCRRGSGGPLLQFFARTPVATSTASPVCPPSAIADLAAAAPSSCILTAPTTGERDESDNVPGIPVPGIPVPGIPGQSRDIVALIPGANATTAPSCPAGDMSKQEPAMPCHDSKRTVCVEGGERGGGAGAVEGAGRAGGAFLGKRTSTSSVVSKEAKRLATTPLATLKKAGPLDSFFTRT
jgi:hypothetical protein